MDANKSGPAASYRLEISLPNADAGQVAQCLIDCRRSYSYRNDLVATGRATITTHLLGPIDCGDMLTEIQAMRGLVVSHRGGIMIPRSATFQLFQLAD